MERTERHLEQVTAEAGAPLAAHANATVAAGGKRLRPLWCARGPVGRRTAGGGRSDGEERLVRAAVAVELVHSATLVHDDLIDGAQLRRGRPTVAAARRARGGGRDRRPAVLARVRRARAQRATRPSSGRSRRPAPPSPKASCCSARTRTPRTSPVERYLRRCELKTAALFEAACRLGALTAAEARPALADALGAFAARIGLAFQFLDDVLDVSGPVERTGKARGTDLLDGTVTLPFILARERDAELAEV